MHKKAYSILIIDLILLMVAIPASAYDYQGVPQPGENNFDDSTEIMSDFGDFAETFDSVDFSSLISLLILFFLQILGIPLS